MLKIEKFSQILKYNYKKDSVRLYMLNKKKQNNLFFEKILTQTQVRKLTTLDIFKIKKIYAETAFMWLLYLFSKYVWRITNLCLPHKWWSHLTKRALTFPNVTFAFFVTWIVLFFLTFSTYSCFIKLTLMDCSRLPERATIVIHVRFDKRYHQIPTKLKAFCTCISCIHCIYCLTMDSAPIKDIS